MKNKEILILLSLGLFGTPIGISSAAHSFLRTEPQRSNESSEIAMQISDAIAKNDLEALNNILAQRKSGANYYFIESYVTVLAYALFNRSAGSISILLAYGIDPVGDFSIHTAINKGDLDLVKAVLSRKFQEQINLKNKEGLTPLFYAINKAWPEIFQFLIDHGADLDLKNNNNQDLLTYAIGEKERLSILMREAKGPELRESFTRKIEKIQAIITLLENLIKARQHATLYALRSSSMDNLPLELLHLTTDYLVPIVK